MRCVGLAPHNNHVQATPHEGGNIAKKVMWGVIIYIIKRETRG